MRNSLDEDFDPATARIGDYMTPGVKCAAHTDSAYELMDKFLGLRLRHLLIDKKGEFIGLLSVVDVMRTALQEKTREFGELHTVATWEYYEEWRPRQ
jgi:signal-transduction protein with cAMP-binding, CBS, and nucleotidyltransferase domain